MSERTREDRRVAAALRDAGVIVESVFDLVNSNAPYPNSIPALMELLRVGVSDGWIMQGIVRALSVKEARGVAGPLLVERFQEASADDGLKWAIANALFVVATAADQPNLVRLARDKRHGRARQMLVATLGRLRTAESEAELIALVEDRDIVAHALGALGRYRGSHLESVVQRFLDDRDPLVRRSAATALRRLRRV